MEACCLCEFEAKNGQDMDEHIEHHHSDIFIKISDTKNGTTSNDIGTNNKGQSLEEKATYQEVTKKIRDDCQIIPNEKIFKSHDDTNLTDNMQEQISYVLMSGLKCYKCKFLVRDQNLLKKHFEDHHQLPAPLGGILFFYLKQGWATFLASRATLEGSKGQFMYSKAKN